MVIKDNKPGTPKKVTVPNVNTLMGIIIFKELTKTLSPYNNKNAKIIFFTKKITFFIINVTQ